MTISRLRLLARYFKGIPEQQEIYSELIEKLRTLYMTNKTAFSESVLAEINSLKKKIKTVVPAHLSISPRKPEKISKGAVVFHRHHYYVGVIDGTTKLKHLFEDRDNTDEFRVRISKEEVRIASGENLKVIGSAYTNRCYGCKAYVGYSLDQCNKCGWFICLSCGACGCGYHRKDWSSRP